MASEKQVAYIKRLIEELQPENMPWWNKEVTGVDEDDRQRGIVHQKHNRRRWIFDAMDINPFDDDAPDYETAVAQYRQQLEQLAKRDWASVDSRTASKAIDSLKQCRIIL